MNLQSRNLSLRTQGPDVRLLHIELRKLGYTIQGQEYGEKNFGPATHKAVLDFQRKHNLPDNGVVDETTAKRMAEAVDKPDEAVEFIVKGKVTQPKERLVAGVNVKAFDKDIRSEEFLGEALTDGKGRYKIRYTAHQFRRAEKKSADLIVRIYSKEEVLLTESDVIYNAKPSETVNLLVELPTVAKPSEYDLLLGTLKPVLEDIQPADLTKEDVAFLLKELSDEKIVTKLRLQLLADSAHLARQTRLPAEAFYGLARQLQFKPPLTLKAFLALTNSDCESTLKGAIENNIIPRSLKDSIDNILARLEQLKIENKVLLQRTLTGRLLNEKTGKPLVNYRVRAAHHHGEEPPRNLGTDTTDRRGSFAFTLTTPPPAATTAAEPPVDRLSLSILNADNETIHRAEFEIQADQTELPDIPVPASALPQPPVRPIQEVTTALGLELPTEFEELLAEHKIGSIEDFRRNALTLKKDPRVVEYQAPLKVLGVQANLGLLRTSVADNAVLDKKGFTSIAAIAARPLKSFMDAVGPELGTPKAREIHAIAKAQGLLLDSILTDARVEMANGGVPMALLRDSNRLEEAEEYINEFREQFRDDCTCRDCEAAVSPAAYLADLLDYTVEHVKNGTGAADFITLTELAELVHQPLGDLPASCESVAKQVRQVRICIEVLREIVESLPDEDEKAYRFSAYQALLTKLGTSYEELRLTRTADDDTRRALADRLGIDLPGARPDPLDALLLDPDTITEESLEMLFGLVDTSRDPLADGLTRGDSHDQISQWELSGVEWNWNTDDLGLIYVRLSHPAPSRYCIDLYRDEARTQRVATGEINSTSGRVGLAERQHSGLAGAISLDFSSESDDIVLVAFPELLRWRLQHLRTLWQVEDGIADPYTSEPVGIFTEEDLLPVIDPDLIGPDDFRTPFEKARDTDPDRPFDLWIRRRGEIEQRLQAIREEKLGAIEDLRNAPAPVPGSPISDAQVFIRLLQRFYESPDIANRFEELAEDLRQGREIETAGQAIRDDYRLTVESFLRLREIYDKALELQRLARESGSAMPQPLPEEAWEEVLSILLQADKRDLYVDWRAEEAVLEGRLNYALFGPRYFWDALREPTEGTWPLELPEDEEQPFIDPDEIKLKELPEPTAGQRAISLWHRRREELTEQAEELKHRSDTESFHAMLAAALGDVPDGADDWPAYLTDLLDRARRAEVGGVEHSDLDAELAALHLDQEQLSRVVEILSGTDTTEADWAETYSLLTTAWKERIKWPVWLAEEQSDPVLADPVSGQRKDWRICKARLPKWRASMEDRQVWRLALQRRCRRPIIDPDLIGTGFLRDPTSGEARELWHSRDDWIRDGLASLAIDPEGAEATLDQFDNILVDNIFDSRAVDAIEAQYRMVIAGPEDPYSSIEIGAVSERLDDFIQWTLGVARTDLEALLSNLDSPDAATANKALQQVTERLGLSVSAFRLLMRVLSGISRIDDWNAAFEKLARASLVAYFASLDQAQQQGEAITGRLAQLGLTAASYAYLLRMRRLVVSGAELQDTEWADVYSILLQVRKSRAAADWLEKEQEGAITLGPVDFKIPEPPPLQFPPREEEPLPTWRATQKELRKWRNDLKARIEQVETTIAALQEAVSSVEEETLPALRNALVMATDVEGGNLTAKAKRLTDLLLIDMQSSGCEITTRISQAIETVRELLESIRDGQLQDTYPDLALDAENFDEEWKWLGTYANRRAAMFVFLYPENTLLPSLRTVQTPGFEKLVNDLRVNSALSPKGACVAATDYAKYFEDICSLSIQATCYGNTCIYIEDLCHTLATPEFQKLFYIFGKGGRSGGVYWSALYPDATDGPSQMFWDNVPGLEDIHVTRILGSAPYNKTDDQRFIFLFILAEEGAETKLKYTRYDLNAGSWDSEPAELELPPLFSYSKIVLVQSCFDNEPPKLAFYTLGSVFIRGLNSDGNEWEGMETSEESENEENDWQNFSAFGNYDYCALHAVVECERDGSPYRFVAISAIHSGTGRPSVRLNYEDISGHSSDHGTIYQGLDNIVLDFVGVIPFSSTVWRIYYTDEEGNFYKFSTDETFENLGRVLNSTVDSITRLARVIPHYSATIDAEYNHVVFERYDRRDRRYLTEAVLYRWIENSFQREDNRKIYPECPPQLRPWQRGRLTSAFAISEQFTQTELQDRRYLIRKIFLDNRNEPCSIQSYIEEAYYFVPVYLALQLQQHGNYTAALDWFRNVYDYREPANGRKISYFLKREEDLSYGYGRTADWLLDPLDPHRIAANRRETYTRFTLQALVRCFLEYADEEFTQDTAESVARARALYATALELLDESALGERVNRDCEELIGELVLEIGQNIQTSSALYQGSWNLFVRSLYNIRDSQTLLETIGVARSIARREQSWETRMTAMLDVVSEVLSPHLPRAMSEVTNRRENYERAHATLLSHGRVVGAVNDVADSVAKRLGNVPPMIERFSAAESLGEMYEWIGSEAAAETPVSPNHYQPMLAFDFCIAPNPVPPALRLKAELNLYKIRTCRNIAGMERQLEPYAAPTDMVSGVPGIDNGERITTPIAVTQSPTLYRYQYLIDRTKHLVDRAAQMEGAFLASLEKLDAEYYNLMKARQDLKLTKAGVRLQELRVREAENGMTLAEQQIEVGLMRSNHYKSLLQTPISQLEKDYLDALSEAASKYSGIALSEESTDAEKAQARAQAASFRANMKAAQASFERREEEWQFQEKISLQDIELSRQQLKLATDRVAITRYERVMGQMQAAFADATVDFLANKFTNVDLYDWMSGVLQKVYNFFLQQATALAQLAEMQLAFERQQPMPAIIQADYWAAPSDNLTTGGGENEAVDRRGLTGSARLLADIYRLDQYRLESEQRKLQLTKTISLALLAPTEFQRFRKTGVMVFDTPMTLFDKDFPGHYLRLIKRVRTSVIALIPSVEGIKATLATTGLSRVDVIWSSRVKETHLMRFPEAVALSSPTNATGLFELWPQLQPEMLLPFEGMGVATSWEFRMPKAANRFDYTSLMDVLITIEYAALDDFAHRQKVIRELDDLVSGEQSFSFRHDLPDQWYSLHHPEQTDTPMVVRFETRRADFPPNIEELSTQHLLLYFVLADGTSFEVQNVSLKFTEQGGTAPIGGTATTVEGLISTRSTNADSWKSMTGNKSLIGQWELALPNSAEMRNRFTNDEIENILFVISYRGTTPPWPE